jgi:hypothetical protein
MIYAHCCTGLTDAARDTRTADGFNASHLSLPIVKARG